MTEQQRQRAIRIMADEAERSAFQYGFTSYTHQIHDYLDIPFFGLPAGDSFYMVETNEWVVV